jgi:Predicted solute binding protein
MSQIRADFTNCALPADSLTGTCISGAENEPDNCGYGTNVLGLCGYCASSSPNATDSCCINSNATGRCTNVHLPTTTTLPPLFPSSTSTSTSTSTSLTSATSVAAHRKGLSGGQIAGAVIGSVAGFALLAALLAFLCIRMRRRRNQQAANILNQPTPQRRGPPQMQYSRTSADPQGYSVLAGGRVARMSALQADSRSPSRSRTSARAIPGKYSDSSDSEGFGASPSIASRRGPPVANRRKGSLSSTSMLAGDSDNSPRSGTGGQFSSPEGVASGQSEQLPYFRDYYSQDDIHPGDRVAVLWAYQPRAADEFQLERGEVLKVVGIWDDGWATGIRVNERAEDYDGSHRAQRDSGVSNGSEKRASSPQPSREIKAFPLVCVCLPQHWRKTIEGDIAAEG